MSVSIIAAIGRKGELGFENQLIWRIPGDLANFKKLTMGHHIIMGRKTYESIGRPLPGRTNFVLSRGNLHVPEHVYQFQDLQTAVGTAIMAGESEIFIIGGASVYKEALSIATRMYITHIHDESVADSFFNPDWSQWKIIEEKHYDTHTPAWTFRVYDRQ